ncbi:ISL3 family transposase [Microtetraspora sp. NBRC 16547]|uniref:ISL3 family transposase n=1 Tax=Microtetraspora sp. NBRC 16547 TaxID=3030993 RepID=UPI002552FD07|nr:ISL3 family transposase [Microtetraspora sp. NBRC 16547]
METVTCTENGLLICARTRYAEPSCPSCGTSGRRVHSRYRRRLSDVTCGDTPVTIELEARRFFCANPVCAAVTFAEQVPDLTAAYARRTPALSRLLASIALALAGRAGTRLSGKLGIHVSRSLLIRLIRALPDPEIGQVTVLGVDDFAKRKGHAYATVLVDMATHRPIDVLDERRGDVLADWLRDHPGIEVICRDRAGAYAEGARDGAPEAIQVADRWHLWKNLCDAVEKTVRAHRADLDEPAPQGEEPVEAATQDAPSATETGPIESRTTVRTRERHAAIHALLTEGRNITQICRILGLDRKTVNKYRHAASADELLNGPRFRSRAFNDFVPYLQQRWEEGCTDAAVLFTEITARGYRGSARSVRRYVQPLRAALGMSALPPPPPTVRQMTQWITRRPDRLTEDDQVQLKDVLTRSPRLTALAGHVAAFARLLLERRGQDLAAWMTAVEADDLPQLHSFARGLRRDQAAVLHGLTLEHSSGAVEGNVNRIKALKRQMYGRAKLDLLRKRILLGA